MEHCQADVGSIETDVKDIQEQWDAICSVLHEVQDKIPKMREAVPAYEEQVKPLEESLVEADNVLAQLEPFALDTDKGNEQLDELKVWFLFDLTLLVFLLKVKQEAYPSATSSL